jgi:hypothetical protein
MIWALVAVAALFGGGGWYLGYEFESGRWAKADAERLAAEAIVREQAIAARQEAENYTVDMLASFEAGKAAGRVAEKSIGARLATEVKLGAFANPECRLPAQSFGLLTATLRGVRSGVTIPAEDVRAPVASPAAAPPQAATAPTVQPVDGKPPKPIPRKKAP